MCNEHGPIASKAAVLECPNPPRRAELPAVERKQIPEARTRVDEVLHKIDEPKALPPVPTTQASVAAPPPSAAKAIPPMSPKAAPLPVPVAAAAPQEKTDAFADVIRRFTQTIPAQKPTAVYQWYKLIEGLASLVGVTIAATTKLSDKLKRQGRTKLIRDKLRNIDRNLLDQIPDWFWQ